MEPRRRNGQRQKGRPLAGIAEAWVEEGMGSGVEASQPPNGKLGLGEECQVLGTPLCLL